MKNNPARTKSQTRRWQLIVGYDGAPFEGWQSQAHGNTVQDHLERAFARITGEKIRVHGAGRTDTGVHALAQSAHVDLPGRDRPPEQWQMALNANLPPTIRVLRCRAAAADFHARYSAKGKIYRYRLWTGAILPPHEQGRVWRAAPAPDFALLHRAAGKFVGRHDFAGFAANRAKPEVSTVRTIRSVKLRRQGSLWTLEFEGDGFLYKMVRMMVGAAVRVAQGKDSIDELVIRLNSGAKESARLVAPAEGLFLIRVRY